MRRDRRFGRAGCARGEQQQRSDARVDGRRGQSRPLVRPQRVGVVRRVDDEYAIVGEAEVEPRSIVYEPGLGDDQLAVGIGDVACELGSLAGRVDADHRGATHRAGSQPQAQLGNVLEQESDVERTRAPRVHGERGRESPRPVLPRAK